MEYYVKKREFKKENIEYIEIFFDNGDYFPISKTEIIDISTRLYDKLILGKDYWNSFCAVTESGFLKLKLQKKAKGFFAYPRVYNQREYNKDRIGYIKNRLCEGGVNCIKLFDGNNWHFTLYCLIEPTLDDEYLNLKFIPHKKESHKKESHNILLPEMSKAIISGIELDFENCEGVNIEPSEIIDMHIVFNKELCWGSGDYVRQIESGFLKIKLDPELNEGRKNSLFDNLANGKKGNLQIERRLCGKRGFELHDICHLYVEYDYAGSGFYKRECLEINDIRSKEEFAEIEKLEEKEGREFAPYFLGGYAEKVDKNTILITFGKTALKDERCQSELKKYSVFNIKAGKSKTKDCLKNDDII